MSASAMRLLRRGLPVTCVRSPIRDYGGLLFLLTMILAFCAGCSDSANTPSPVGLMGTPAPPFQSGGIGLTKAAWEQQHTPSSEPSDQVFVWYPDHDYEVSFWHDWPLRPPTPSSLISTISFDTHANTPEAQRAAVRSLLPADAQLEPDVSYPGLEIWYSPSLINRYPPFAAMSQVWGTFGPGRIRVRHLESASFVDISALLYGPPKPTDVVPVRPTPTLCGDHPCPTPTYTLPSPVPTAVRSPVPGAMNTALPRPLPSNVPLLPHPTAAPSRAP